MITLYFEKVEHTYEGKKSAYYEIMRTHVPGGWLVVVKGMGDHLSVITFVSDPNNGWHDLEKTE
jgi:hypothetical protein